MHKFTCTLACSTILLFGPQSAIAASAGDTYIGVGFSQLTYSEDGISDLNPTMLGLKAGYYLNSNFSVEGRLGFGIGDDSVRLTNFPTPFGNFTGDYTVEIDNIMGVYAVGHVPVTDMLDFYGFFGFNRADFTFSVSGTLGGIPGSGSVSDDDNDTAYGIGADIKLNKTSSINIEYGNFYNDGPISVDAITIGFTTSL